MKIVTFNTYPWVDAKLREKHDVTRIEKEEKIPFWSKREKPDRYIIFGWWPRATAAMAEMKKLGIKSAIYMPAGYLRRSNATVMLDAWTRLRSSYDRTIFKSSDHDAKAFEKISASINEMISKSGKKWVIKVGDSHQGEDKHLVTGSFRFEHGTDYIIEPYVEGRSVRVLIIDKQIFKIEHINNHNWIKNIEPEQELVGDQVHIAREVIEDAKQIAAGLKFSLIGIDYQVAYDRVLPLEINIMPGCPDDREAKAAYAQWFLDNCS